MNVAELGQWYYLIYVVPAGAALLTLALAFMGGDLSDGDADADVDGDGTEVETYGGEGPEVEVDGDSGPVRSGFNSALHSGQHGVQSHHGGAAGVLRFFGFGSIPEPFAWGSLLLGWGICGFWATQAFHQHSTDPGVFVRPAMLIATVGALGMARLAAFGIGKLLPAEKSRAVSNVDLCGLKGRVSYPVDDVRGRVIVYDQHGTMHDCRALTAAGQPAIARGKSVLVVDYDDKRDLLIVEESVAG